MTAAPSEPDVEKMVAEMLATAKEEGRNEVLVECRTVLMILANRAETNAGAADTATARSRLSGQLEGLQDAIAWVALTLNGGEVPE